MGPFMDFYGAKIPIEGLGFYFYAALHIKILLNWANERELGVFSECIYEISLWPIIPLTTQFNWFIGLLCILICDHYEGSPSFINHTDEQSTFLLILNLKTYLSSK